MEESSVVGLDSPIQFTAQLHAFPNRGLSPYIGAGVQIAENTLSNHRELINEDLIFGTHVGLGLRYRLGALSINVEGRYMTYEDVGLSQLQGLGGVNIHF